MENPGKCYRHCLEDFKWKTAAIDHCSSSYRSFDEKLTKNMDDKSKNSQNLRRFENFC